MIRRVAAATLALALALGMTTACQPEPAPSPSAPVFANEEEAFAAAEETYRAYVDALNQVDLSDPETFEAVYAWTRVTSTRASERRSSRCTQTDGRFRVRRELPRIDQLESSESLDDVDARLRASTCARRRASRR